MKSNLSHKEIYCHDSKQISWIINNRRTQNNRFLITDAALDTTDDFLENDGLVHKLPFNNIKEILWGTDEEIRNYLQDLFRIIWNEVSSVNNAYQIDKELFMSDYVPYAKYSTYWNILFSVNNVYPAILYGILEDDVINNIDSARDSALLYFYEKCKSDFEDIFLEFANRTKSFSKINKVFLKSFIEDSFIPMLNEYQPDDHSLGLRVKKLIASDLAHCASLVYDTTLNNRVYLTNLINASSVYIVKLEDIQRNQYRLTNNEL
ncbi:hypothetical protein ACHAL6_08915 [Proteiniclasticum sp. C24MP]|uniref:hypothetical protein n=1 Tax=Proteiniclasticum sp. C24MP TaxID=3374101 RepID=UPI003753FF97